MADLARLTLHRGGAFFALVLIACALFAPSQAARAQEEQKTEYGDWKYVCDTPPGAQNKQCALVQLIIDEDRQNVGLNVAILRTADRKVRLLRVMAPLGVLLPAELGLKIDGEDIGSVRFVRCVSTGCVAEVPLDDALIEKLKAGKEATFIIFETPEQGIGIPVNLSGLDQALELIE